jgi:excisionase family DNA binding protein
MEALMNQKHTEQRQPALLVSKREAAAMLGVCVRSIDNYIAAKELPCRRLGKRVLIPYPALVQFSRRDHVAATEQGQ